MADERQSSDNADWHRDDPLSVAFKSVRTVLSNLKNENCSQLALFDIFQKFIQEGRRTITFVLVGKAGVGKSRFTNALIGKHVAVEGNDLDPESMEVRPYELMSKEGIKITVWDTPGFADCSNQDQRYLEDIAKKVELVDLLIYCTPMNDKRFRPEDKETIQKITTAFGASVWNRGIIALTFANLLQNGEEAFLKRKEEFRERFQKSLEEAGVVIMVPVVPAGDIGKPQLPGIKDWLPVFWLCAFQRTATVAKPAMLQINYSRFVFNERFSPKQEEGRTASFTSKSASQDDLYIQFDEIEEGSFWGTVFQGMKKSFPLAIRAAEFGSIAGSAVPGLGNLIGSAVGFVAGGFMAFSKFMYDDTYKGTYEVSQP